MDKVKKLEEELRKAKEKVCDDKKLCDKYTDEDIYNTLSKNIENKTTRELYIRHLKNITSYLDKTVCETIKTPKSSYKKIKKKYNNDNTRLNYVSAIINVFKHCGFCKDTKVYDEWYEIQKQLSDIRDKKSKENKASSDELKNMINFDDIKKKFYKLSKEKEIHEVKQTSQELILIGLYAFLKPKRADYNELKIVKGDKNLKEDENYLVLTTQKNSYILLNNYKTSKHYGELKEKLHSDLVREIKKSLKEHPRKYLFTKLYKDQTEPLNKNDYSKYLKRTFSKYFDKDITINHLRHNYISEIDFNKTKLEDLEKISKSMGHTLRKQQEYKWVNKK